MKIYVRRCPGVSCIPYGYEIKNGEITINEDAKARLIRFFERYISGESIAEAGRELPLSISTLRLTLKRELYVGDSYYPPIITKELFDAAQAAMRARTRVGRKKREPRKVCTSFKYIPMRGPDRVRSIYQSIVPAPVKPDIDKEALSG